MGSLLSAWLESMGGQLREDDDGGRATLSKETMDAGLNVAVKDNDDQFPPEWRLSRSGSPPPRRRLTVPAPEAERGRSRRRVRATAALGVPGRRPLDLDRRRLLHEAAGRRRRRGHQGRVARGRPAATLVGLGGGDPGRRRRRALQLPRRLQAQRRGRRHGRRRSRLVARDCLDSADAVVWSRGSPLAEQASLRSPRGVARPSAPDRHVDHAVRARRPLERQAGHRVHAAGLVRGDRRTGAREARTARPCSSAARSGSGSPASTAPSARWRPVDVPRPAASSSTSPCSRRWRCASPITR